MFRCKTAFALSLILLAVGTARSAEIHVPDDHPTIQIAISLAKQGDTVIVRPGTYHEMIDFFGKAITVRSEQGPSVTTIDGNGLGSVVTFQSGEGRDSILEGFTITHGLGSGGGYGKSGGGVLCLSSSPTIINNVIVDNRADFNGGGILCYHEDCSPWIDHNVIVGNRTESFGGGIDCWYADSPEITNNLIAKNIAGYQGGGLNCSFSGTPVIEGNIVLNNRAGDQGGGVAFSGSPVLANNVIAGNTARDQGGGVWTYWSFTVIEGNTIHGNEALTGEGGGIYTRYDSSLTLDNTILWDNSAPEGPEIHLDDFSGHGSSLTATYSNVKGGQASVYVGSGSTLNWGPGMIDADPLFVDVLHWNFRLQQDPCQQGVVNPCVDSGDPASPIVTGSTRTDGVQDAGIIDMGFHYPLSPVLDIKCNGEDQSVFINAGEDATVTIAVASSGYLNSHVDTWVVAQDPNGMKWFCRATGGGLRWISRWRAPYGTGPLTDLNATVWDSPLATGRYRAWLAVDAKPDGRLELADVVAEDEVDFEVLP